MANRKRNTTPWDKVAATIAAVPLITVETALNAEHLAHGEGWISTLVAGAIAATLAAAAALPIAERAAAKGYWLTAGGLVVFFLIMVAFSFSTSVGRISSKADEELAGAQSHNSRIQLTREAYEEAKRKQEAECTSGTKANCRKAERVTSEARAALSAAPAAKAEGGGTGAPRNGDRAHGGYGGPVPAIAVSYRAAAGRLLFPRLRPSAEVKAEACDQCKAETESTGQAETGAAEL
jgi:hypothetical protein